MVENDDQPVEVDYKTRYMEFFWDLVVSIQDFCPDGYTILSNYIHMARLDPNIVLGSY